MIKAWWFTNEGENFGDAVCPYILNKMTDKQIVLSDEPGALVSIGSVLFYHFTSPKVIWGAGSISSFHNSNIVDKHEIKAVRGPNTRKRLLKMGIQCPEVYGDPSILLPYIVEEEEPDKIHELSFLPHWVDYEKLKSNKRISEKFNIIDIRSGVHKVIKEIRESKIIISSSLHGIIVPEAFGVKSYFCKMSNKVTGNLFKFQDYYNSTNRITRCYETSDVNSIDVDKIINMYENADPVFEYKKFLSSFPYEIKNRKLLEKIDE
jgi:hypothetical protein